MVARAGKEAWHGEDNPGVAASLVAADTCMDFDLDHLWEAVRHLGGTKSAMAKKQSRRMR